MKNILTFSHQDYEIIERKRVFQGYFAVDRLTLKHRLFDGGWSEQYNREVFERGSAVAVLLYDSSRKEAVFIEQFRVGAVSSDQSPWMIEIVAGIIEMNENEVDVAIREAKEEAGIHLGQLNKIGRYFATPGGSSETISLYYSLIDSSDVVGIFGLEEENEDIRVLTLTIDEIKVALNEGVFENATTLIAVQWLLLNYTTLEKRLEYCHNVDRDKAFKTNEDSID